MPLGPGYPDEVRSWDTQGGRQSPQVSGGRASSAGFPRYDSLKGPFGFGCQLSLGPIALLSSCNESDGIERPAGGTICHGCTLLCDMPPRHTATAGRNQVVQQ